MSVKRLSQIQKSCKKLGPFCFLQQAPPKKHNQKISKNERKWHDNRNLHSDFRNFCQKVLIVVKKYATREPLKIPHLLQLTTKYDIIKAEQGRMVRA